MMKLFKKYEFGQWNVYAFEPDGSQDAYISDDMYSITPEEADVIKMSPHSDEYLERQQKQLDALGNIKMWPPREFKEALGQVCVISAMFESTLRMLIWTVAGLGSDVGMVFTGGKRSSDDLFEMFKLLIQQRDPEFWIRLEPLVVEAKSAFNKRGEFVHSIWTVGSQGKPLIGKFFTEKKPKEGREVSLDELEKLAVSFSDIQGKITDLVLSRFVI